MRYLLVDNGSLRPDSILNLRRVARELEQATGREIIPAPLLHSSKVPADQLEGTPAVNLERLLRRLLDTGERAFTIIPFFFGPTAAITVYLPSRLAVLRKRYGAFEVRRTGFVGDIRPIRPIGPMIPSDLVAILTGRVHEALAETGWECPRVAMVDHGSPRPEVTALRDVLAQSLKAELGEEVQAVSGCSMERREGEAYAFNEPLLENLLDQSGWNDSRVILSMLFLSPGRHAGPGGDIDRIRAAAGQRHPGLRTCMTGLVGDHPGIIPLLIGRLEGPIWEL